MHACLLTCRMHLSDSIVALAPQTMAGTEIVPPSPLRVVVWPRSAPNSVPRRRLDDIAVEALGCLPALPCIVPPPICRVCVCVCVRACVCGTKITKGAEL